MLSTLISARVFTLSPILIGKLAKSQSKEWTVRWIKNWMNGTDQNVTISGAESSWRLVVSGIPQGPILCYIV